MESVAGAPRETSFRFTVAGEARASWWSWAVLGPLAAIGDPRASISADQLEPTVWPGTGSSNRTRQSRRHRLRSCHTAASSPQSSARSVSKSALPIRLPACMPAIHPHPGRQGHLSCDAMSRRILVIDDEAPIRSAISGRAARVRGIRLRTVSKWRRRSGGRRQVPASSTQEDGWNE
jgi:hypothetical protein